VLLIGELTRLAQLSLCLNNVKVASTSATLIIDFVPWFHQSVQRKKRWAIRSACSRLKRPRL